MKVLLTGGKGMLGRTLVRELGGDFEVVPTDLPETTSRTKTRSTPSSRGTRPTS